MCQSQANWSHFIHIFKSLKHIQIHTLRQNMKREGGSVYLTNIGLQYGNTNGSIPAHRNALRFKTQTTSYFLGLPCPQRQLEKDAQDIF